MKGEQEQITNCMLYLVFHFASRTINVKGIYVDQQMPILKYFTD